MAMRKTKKSDDMDRITWLEANRVQLQHQIEQLQQQKAHLETQIRVYQNQGYYIMEGHK